MKESNVVCAGSTPNVLDVAGDATTAGKDSGS